MTDEYGVPERFFGPIDPDLPALLGRTVMVSALIEYQIAIMASAVEDFSQNYYFAQDVTRNIEVCKLRFRHFATETYGAQIAEGRRYITKAKPLLKERNELVHRVWSVAAGDVWGGHKGLRGARELPAPRPDDPGWNYTADRMKATLSRMGTLAVFGRDVAVPQILALPRLPTPMAHSRT